MKPRNLNDLLASARRDEPTPAQLDSLERKIAPLFPIPPGGGGGGTPGGHGAAGGHGGGAASAVTAAKHGAAMKWIGGAIAVAVGGGAAIHHYVANDDDRATIAIPAPPRIEAPQPPPPEPVKPAPLPDPTVAPRPTAKPHALSPEESLQAESKLLDHASAALRDGHASAALDACEHHARTFPHGKMREERERIAIEALLALGRRSDAEARAKRFDRSFPNSVQSERIHALLSHP